ncbi:hypothetical protein Rumeso_02932 [Rubellimicrobium mesophilum DSM 19309]|uniref:Uncharacterized protein n=1 Tax=Rubellimicrobium mesophilum DSM 19309 TaxID=442562 RepID=A0A017HMG8_9RHOB|nr:hypothetical protein [Rubellimicrobium mesophilum]EYD75505.1 hypothetical protein Rumeso_02932 [Rubellimicrobium mesophilum DSM 19309]
MKHDTTPDRRRDEDKVARVIRVAEEVLAQAYRGASRQEMIESQLRVRESVVREMRRRLR